MLFTKPCRQRWFGGSELTLRPHRTVSCRAPQSEATTRQPAALRLHRPDAGGFVERLSEHGGPGGVRPDAGLAHQCGELGLRQRPETMHTRLIREATDLVAVRGDRRVLVGDLVVHVGGSSDAVRRRGPARGSAARSPAGCRGHDPATRCTGRASHALSHGSGSKRACSMPLRANRTLSAGERVAALQVRLMPRRERQDVVDAGGARGGELVAAVNVVHPQHSRRRRDWAVEDVRHPAGDHRAPRIERVELAVVAVDDVRPAGVLAHLAVHVTTNPRRLSASLRRIAAVSEPPRPRSAMSEGCHGSQPGPA